MKILFSAYDEIVNLSDLEDNPLQTNTHSEDQIEDLAYIMREDGITQAIQVVRGTKRIWAGHGRKMAALKNGWTEFPVVYTDIDDMDLEFRLGTSDNIGQRARIDFSLVNEKLELVGPFDIELLGLGDFKIDVSEIKNTNGAKEFNADEFDNFQHECPKCGFEWNEGKN